MPTLRELLDDGRVHVMDGAMGTELYNRGFFVNVCYDELNLTEPDLVREVHEAYVAAGAEIIETNTFGANPVKLSSFGLDERTEEVNRAAVLIARAAVRGRASVVGAIGPLGIRIEPWGPTSREEARAFFARQVRGLLEGEVDGFLLETFSDLDELRQALHAVRDASDLPVIAQVTIGADENTTFGTSVETVATRLTEWGADVVGLNCSVGPAVMLDAIERMAEVTDRPLSAQPNAGLPRAVGDRQHVLGEPGVHGPIRQAHDSGGCPLRGGMLRYDPGAHQEDCRPRREPPTTAHHRVHPHRGACGASSGAGSPRQSIGLGPEACHGRVRDQRRDPATQGLGCHSHARGVPVARRMRRRCIERGRHPAGAEPHGGAACRAHYPEQIGSRNGTPLHVPRPQHARHAERPARRGRRRSPQPLARHR